MSFRHHLRNSIQWLLIRLIRTLQPLLRKKIVLFSEFMASGDQPYLLTKKGDESYIVMTSDVGVSRRLYIGMADEHLKVVRAIGFIKRLRGQEKIDLLIDVGTNLGHICIPIVRNGYVNRAIGFEPDKKNYHICLANILINDLADKVALHNTALGAKPDETLLFELSEDNSGDHRIRVIETDGHYAESKRKTLTVKSTTLDSFFCDLEELRSTLLWIDVQGYEGFVLEGARTILSKRVPIGLEFWPYGLARSGSFENLIRLLKPFERYYNLSLESPTSDSVESLVQLYERYQNDDRFYLDILVL